MCSCRYSDIRWEGEVIVLLGDVRISPPYLPEHCIGSSGVDRIKKLVCGLAHTRPLPFYNHSDHFRFNTPSSLY